MDAILDTSVIIDLFKGDRELLEKLPKDLVYGISVISIFELHCGSLKEREEVFLEKMPKLAYDEVAAKLAVKIFKSLKKNGKVPKVKDLLIASSAIANDLAVVTRDRDFEIYRAFGLKVEIV
ncbi:MAG: type II toxin-antitoxin system VapC family toxin [Archaeoglobus sp.]|uniref:type II toxin-antitoxin system VapC family toxin n=1 Tax=Archaeoglobus sp. TaxID=1872626 RepID=UPI001DAFA428|nr:type II toxin-antitoxin system VapC family toxin [Archaeoglobus sp.]MBO8180814.1 type II toxin-antitoxin system VapC family toxin [Archaeoglobus sp.]